MNPEVNPYFIDGCGRCSLVGTPQCKVNFWPKELAFLRNLVLSCGLKEELKWSMPCYTYQGNNILMIAAFKNYCSISFFKGALLSDSDKILQKAGENSFETRLIKFTDVKQILEVESAIKAYIFEAIEIEKLGLKFNREAKPKPEYPAELIEAFSNDPKFNDAFKALTPGRQRGYLLHFTQPKQSKTKTDRIEKSKAKIFEGKGFNDR